MEKLTTQGQPLVRTQRLLLLITAGFIVIFAYFTYVSYFYDNASDKMIKFTKQINKQQVSVSFMIPQRYHSKYVNQIVHFIQNRSQIQQEEVYIVIRIKSLGSTEQQQIDNFNKIIELTQQSNSQGNPRILLIISGLFDRYNDLEYQLCLDALDRGFFDIYLTLQANKTNTHNKLLNVIQRKGYVRLVKGYYKGDITDRQQIHQNYMKLTRLLIQSDRRHILGTHNLTKITQLQQEFPDLQNKISLSYLYHINDYYQNQLELNPKLKQFNIIPQIQTSDLSQISMIPYIFDAIKKWDYYIIFNLFGINKYFPKYPNIPAEQH